jgi:hypothetical protein
MRDRLFGGGTIPPPPPDTVIQGAQSQAAESLTTQIASTIDTTPDRPTPAGETGGGSRRNRDSVAKPPGGTERPPAGGKVTVELPALDDYTSESAEIRSRARQEARSVYNRTDVLDSVRAEAAMIVGQTFTMDANFRDAEHWLDLAVKLNPRELYQKLLADARQNLERSGQN